MNLFTDNSDTEFINNTLDQMVLDVYSLEISYLTQRQLINFLCPLLPLDCANLVIVALFGRCKCGQMSSVLHWCLECQETRTSCSNCSPFSTLCLSPDTEPRSDIRNGEHLDPTTDSDLFTYTFSPNPLPVYPPSSSYFTQISLCGRCIQSWPDCV